MTARKVGDHVEVEEEEARAGQTGLGMRYVLAFGVILVVIGFVFAATVWFS
jgi:hypothetical protein